MPQSGQEMLDETVAVCEKIADGLGARNRAWEESIIEIVAKFGDVSGTFFFKTMPSIPVTRACSRDAESLLALRERDDWDSFGPGMQRLISSAQNVIEKAGMKGTTLT